MGRKRKLNGPTRLAFTPSAYARAYFDGLVERLTAEHGIEARNRAGFVHITQREAFDRMVIYAVRGEQSGPPAFNIEGTKLGERFTQHLLGKTKVAK